MKKLHALGIALLAAYALSAVVANAAFAESEFLVGGNAAVAGQNFEVEGELLLVDLNAGGVERKVLCSGFLVGEFGGANDALINKVFDLSTPRKELGELPNGAFVSCTNELNCSGAQVRPENLPWLAEVILMTATELLVLLTQDVKGFPAWEVKCTGEFGEPEALCEGHAGFKFENLVSDVDFSVTVAEIVAESEEGLCEDLLGDHLNVAAIETEGEVLATSSAGVTAVS